MSEVYKYKVVTTNTDIGEEKLNEFGKRGWKLCSALSDEFGYKYYFTKREE